MKFPSILVLFLMLICSSFLHADEEANNPNDPFESINRKVFKFNDTLDSLILKPAAKAYKAVTPDPLEKGISNAFENLGEVTTLTHNLLQGDFKQAGKDTGRFIINSTLGVAGLFDVASDMGIEADNEDFGQTLAVWGVESGPYLVLPFVGPSTLRDTPSRYIDNLTEATRYIDHVPTRNIYTGIDVLDTRASLLEAESLLKGDRYSLLRDVYLQRRQFLINDGEVVDDFSDLDDY